jgi:hypothetical protein
MELPVFKRHTNSLPYFMLLHKNRCMHLCNISLHNCNIGSLEDCGKITVFMSVQARHTAALPAAYIFLWIQRMSVFWTTENRCVHFVSPAFWVKKWEQFQFHKTKLNWKVQSYLFKVMYPAVLHNTTHKLLFTVNTTLLILLLISPIT